MKQKIITAIVAVFLAVCLWSYVQANDLNIRVFKSHCTWSQALPQEMTRISGMYAWFTLSNPAYVEVKAMVNLRHRNLVDGPVGWAVRAGLETKQPDGTWHHQWIPGAKASGNIRDVTEHYKDAVVLAALELQPGEYKIWLWGCSHSSLSSYPGLIEANGDGGAGDPYNVLIVTIFE